MSEDVLVALITIGLGTFGLELVKRWFEARAERQDSERKAEESAESLLRKTLESQIEDLRRQQRMLGENVGEWRDKYWALVRDNAVLKEQYQSVSDDVSELRARLRKVGVEQA